MLGPDLLRVGQRAQPSCATRATRARPRADSGSRSTALESSSFASPERRSGSPRARSRAASTRRPTASELSPAPPSSSRARGRGTVTTRSNRSSSARESLSRYAAQPRGRARALRGRIAARAARAEVHRRDELEPGREDDPPAAHARSTIAPSSSGWRSASSAAAGTRAARRGRARRGGRGSPRRAAASSRRRRSRPTDAVWCGARNGATRHERPPGREQPRDGVDARDLERLVRREPRQDPRQAPREHRLPRAGRPGEEQVVTAGGGDLERPPRPLLAAHVREVGHADSRLRTVPFREGSSGGGGCHSPRR